MKYTLITPNEKLEIDALPSDYREVTTRYGLAAIHCGIPTATLEIGTDTQYYISPAVIESLLNRITVTPMRVDYHRFENHVVCALKAAFIVGDIIWIFYASGVAQFAGRPTFSQAEAYQSALYQARNNFRNQAISEDDDVFDDEDESDDTD